MSYELSPDANSKQVFLVNFADVSGKRFDPLYHQEDIYSFVRGSHSLEPLGKHLSLSETGFAAGQGDQGKESDGIIQIRPTNISDDRQLVFNRNIYISPDQIAERPSSLLQKGEVLFNNTNSQELVGKTVYFEQDGDFFASNHITRLKTANTLEAKFLAVILNLYQDHRVFFRLCTNWNNQSGVGRDILEQLLIPLPKLGKQKEIVRQFDAGFQNKLRKEAQAKSQLAGIDALLLRELGITPATPPPDSVANRCFIRQFSEVTGERLDAHFQNPKFDDLEKSLNDLDAKSLFGISNDIFSGITPKSGGDAYAEEGIAFIRSGDFNDDKTIKQKNLIYLKPEIHCGLMKRSMLQKGDVLFAIVGATIGKVGVFMEDFEANINQAVCAVRPNTTVTSGYLHAFFLSSLGQRQIDKIKRPVARANINLEEIGSLRIPIPKMEIQLRIESAVNHIFSEKLRLEQEAQAELDEAKTAIEAMILGE